MIALNTLLMLSSTWSIFLSSILGCTITNPSKPDGTALSGSFL